MRKHAAWRRERLTTLSVLDLGMGLAALLLLPRRANKEADTGPIKY